MLRTAPWTIADLIDFEFLLSDEGGVDPARDEKIFREQIAPQLGPEQQRDRRTIFRQWLELRRREAAGALPGRQYLGGWHALLTLGVVFGLLLGGGLALTHLSYQTNEPINLPKFLLWTIGLQWLVLILAAAFWLLRRALPDLRDFYPLQAILWGVDALLRRLPGGQRERLRATIAILRRKREIYGSVAVWPLVIVTQLFAVMFNVGVLAMTLVLVQVEDLRFGWQTTPHVTPEQASERVALFALPWSWAPNAAPTPAQISASRYSPGQHLDTVEVAAARAWWPFVIYAVTCYGLLVRLALLAYAALSFRGTLRRVAFDHADANALLRRLVGPIVHTPDTSAGLVIPANVEASTASRMAGPAMALIATDAEISEAELAPYLQTRFGWKLTSLSPAEIDRPGGNAGLIETITRGANDLAAIVVVVRARRAPIRAIALFLEKIAAAAGAKPEVILLLIGRRAADGKFAPASDEEFTHWKNFNAIHGLHLGLERWVS